jgi:pimeloyl-ACP methyl ester carboxylesterase
MTTKRPTCALMLCAAMLLTAWTKTIAKQPPAVTGDWHAIAGRQHLTLKIDRDADGTLTATLVAVDQGNAVVPIDGLSAKDDGTVRIGMKAIGASFEGKLSADGNDISGVWQQGGGSVPLVFRRPGTAPAYTLKPVTKGRVALQPCRTANGATEALCGTYEVFENRRLKSGRKIALNVMVLPAKDAAPAPDPFFALAGGPGQSATEAFPLVGFVEKVRSQRDVVLVDQRGTGKSNLLACALQSIDDAQAVLGEPYSLDKIRQCRAESDKTADTTQYTTSIAVEDLDEVRSALGYDRINLFGGSYGAKPALVYLRMYGAHVRTLTLEAIASPQFLIPLPFAKGLQSSVDGVIALCAVDPACHSAYPELRRQFDTVVARLADAPAHFLIRQQPITLSKEMFLSKLRSVLYVPQFVSALPLIVGRAFDGDWTIYGAVVMQLAALLDGAVARGASFAAICAEDVPGFTPEAIRAATEGTGMGDSQVRRYEAYCKAWGPVARVPKDFYAPVRSNVPALLISGALDPGTPPEMARQAAQYLPGNRLITVKQGTHGTGSPCMDGLIAEFVKRGSAVDLDASCVDQIHLPTFVTR